MSRESSTLVDLLRWRALNQPNEIAYGYLVDGENKQVYLTYQQLERHARAIAIRLGSLIDKGQHVLLLYPQGLEFVTAFFGCLYAGAVAVPASLPDPARLKYALTRLRTIADDAQPVVVLTTSGALPLVENLFENVSGSRAMQCLITDTNDSEVLVEFQDPEVDKETLACLQYTSGSTVSPRGVMISHGNLMANLALISQCFEHTGNKKGVIWLPHYHDMGLIGGVLQPLYAGFPVTLMSPTAFLLRPFRWLQAISQERATISGAPNFAYDLCVRRITPEQCASLDLSSWHVAFNGSEPVRAETLERFANAFAPYGFRRDAFYPCYGLAEATLLVAGSGLRTHQPLFHMFKKSSLEHDKVASVSGDKDAQKLVGCQVPPGVKIAIVDPERAVRFLPDEVGEIWISGNSVAAGYWNRPQETEHTYKAYLSDTREGPFLRTGDLGFVWRDNLFITGRIKDLIIIGGRNHYPQDIERTIEQNHPALRAECCAAFAVDIDDEEKLIVFAEVDPKFWRDQLNGKGQESLSPEQARIFATHELVGAIRQTVAEYHDLRVHEVLLLKTGAIPKTSSGKIQRYACRSRFLQGSIQTLNGTNYGA